MLANRLGHGGETKTNVDLLCMCVRVCVIFLWLWCVNEHLLTGERHPMCRSRGVSSSGLRRQGCALACSSLANTADAAHWLPGKTILQNFTVRHNRKCGQHKFAPVGNRGRLSSVCFCVTEWDIKYTHRFTLLFNEVNAHTNLLIVHKLVTNVLMTQILSVPF